MKLVYSKMAKLCPDRKYELSNGQQQQAISIYFFLEGLGFIEIVNVLGESFGRNVFFWNHILHLGLGAGLGWGLGAGLGWAGLGWAGGWAGWAGLGWAGLGWAGLGWAGLGWAGLGWAVGAGGWGLGAGGLGAGAWGLEPGGWAGRAELGWGLGLGWWLGWRVVGRSRGWEVGGWAGLGWAGQLGLGIGLRAGSWELGAGGWQLGGLGWAGWAGWTLRGSPETEIGLFENGKVCIHRKNELPYVQHQQAISIYFFLEGLGFRV